MLNFLTGSGRTNRLGYLCTHLGIGVLGVIAMVPVIGSSEVDQYGEPVMSGDAMLALFAVSLFSTWLWVANSNRRFHDLGYSGWMTLLFFVPLLNLVVGLYLLCGAGNPTLNKYGHAPSPLFGWRKSGPSPADQALVTQAQAQAQAAHAAQEASYYDADGKYDMDAMFR